jgi:hypothetical protein
MKSKQIKKEKITKLKTEIKIKDFIIKELMTIITNNKIKLPEKLLKNIYYLYTGENNEL